MFGLFVVGAMSLCGSFLAAFVLQSDDPLHAQEDGDKVVTSELQLKDDDGKLRALMSVDDNGDVLFALLDANEQVRITQSVGNDGSSGVIIIDDKGNKRMALTSDEKNDGAFSVFDSEGEPAAVLAVADGNFPMLSLRGPTGEALLGIENDGTGIFAMSANSAESETAGGGRYFSVVGGAGEDSVLMLENKAGSGMYQVVSDPDGVVQESINQGGELRYFVRTGKDEGTSLQLDNPGGSRVYLQAQKGGRSLMQLNGGESYLRAMSNGDGSGEFAIIKKKAFAWKETGDE